MINRRDLLAFIGATGLAIRYPLIARAQQASTKVFRVGVLGGSSLDNFGPFRETLATMGYTEGQNIQFIVRTLGNEDSVLQAAAAELVSLKVDLIVAGGTPQAQAATAATSQIPLVLWAGDLLDTGVIVNKTHPGGNATGISEQSAEAARKIIGLIRDLVPGVHRVAMLLNETDPLAKTLLEQAQSAADAIGLTLQVRYARSGDVFDAAFAAMAADHAEAVFIQNSLQNQAAIDAALRNRLPSFSNGTGTFTSRGGLLGYHASNDELGHQLARYIDLVLKGAKPGDIPVELPSKFDLAINLKTAKTLGIVVPPSVLYQATELIQ